MTTAKDKPKPLAPYLERALKAFRSYEKTTGVAPTLDDLALSLKVTKSTARTTLMSLREAGCAMKIPIRERNWRLTPRGLYHANRLLKSAKK